MPPLSVARFLPVLLVCCLARATCLGAEAPDADRSSLARRILADAGVRGGLVVHVGCGDGRLTAALGAHERHLVQGLSADAASVEQARKQIQSLGLYGDVSVARFDGKRLPYADNMVNLLVAEDASLVGMEELMRVLVPGGVLCVARDGQWTQTVKPRPAEIDEWTHWLHGPDGNAVARDTIVGPPRRLQWIAKPYWSRHHHTVPSATAFVSAGPRVFYIVDEAPGGMDGSAPDKWVLVARDAFNGLPLWRKPMPEWGWKTWSADWKVRFTIPTHIARRLVAVGDRVYVTLGFNAPLTELDAATGEVLRVFEGTELTDEILVSDGKLILALNQARQRPGPISDDQPAKSASPRSSEPPVGKSVAVVDVGSGKMLWKTGDYVGLRSKTGSMERISHLSMCVGDGRVFFVDGDRIVALSLADGRELWQTPRPEIPEHKMRYNIRLSDMCSLVYQQGVLFFAQLNPDKRVGWRGVRGRLHAFSAATGKELWDRQCASWGWGHPADVFVVGGLVWAHDFETPSILGMDTATGEVRRKISNFEAFDNGHHHRCYRNKATTRFMMTSYRGLEFINWDYEAGRAGADKQTDLNHWVRGTCRLGAFPCNGMIYATPHPCSCYISSKLNGFIALAPEAEASSSEADAHELQRGPAYGENIHHSSFIIHPSRDWPMYRHDRRRSGSTATSLAPDLTKVWEVDLGASAHARRTEKPTGCVAVGDTVLTAVPDAHQVVALSANEGKRIWSFTAGGRIDTPPTIDRGRAYFGCADGWLYCVRLSDGRLAWRLRGAPQERFVGALDGIESAWPIHGSPLVEDGVVYFTAGRSSFLDGGILAFAVDARTGKIISRRTIASDHAMEIDAGTDRLGDSGLLADLLVGRGKSITMRQRQIFPEPNGEIGNEAWRAGNDVLRTTSGMLDDEWFSRARWYLGDRPIAEYLVFDDAAVYGVRAREAMTGYGGFFAPGTEGYELFAAEMAAIMGVDTKKVASAGKKEYGIKIPKRWSIRVPVRVTSMVLCGDTLFAAGAPDVLDRTDPWAAYEGRRGGKLLALSAADGEILAECELDAPPILDGMAVSGGRLLVSTVDGKVLCYVAATPGE
ncbi:MAG: PQQ-binding-like beta-propeller repeat protein [Candidatus Nealsonbacteria bacterium]|nr:PQQ-binding-like beta-propeller repeat protein [Candidatus Nealsonbacteria bacterium]